MSKAVKQGFLILAVLFLLSIAWAVMNWYQNQKLQEQARSLTQQLADSQDKQSQLVAASDQLKKEIQALNDQLSTKDKERSKFQTQYDDLKSRYDQISTQVDQLTKDRDDWKDRSTTITQERDRLMKELQERPEKIVEKVVYKEQPKQVSGEPQATQPGVSAEQPDSPEEAGEKNADGKAGSAVVAQAEADSAKQQKDEAHWAEILKEKAALEIEIEKNKKELDQSAIQIVEMKKQASDMQLEIDKLKNEREEIVRKIKYGEDLADNLSIELARAKNDQKYVAERADKVATANASLQSQVKQLTTTKLALERTISRLTGDKSDIQKKLVESESVIQSRLDDISNIKKNIDSRMRRMPTRSDNQVELSPIVVNANGSSDVPQAAASNGKARTRGHIVSINSDNNFVIIDMGEKDGIKIGNTCRVYRGSKEIARLEVIQVRRDISAADIKKKATALQVGDSIR